MIAFGLPPCSLSAEPRTQDLIIEELPVGDPFSAYRSLRKRFSNSFLLESASGPERLATHTFIGFAPQHLVALRQGRMLVDGVDIGPAREPIAFLREIMSRWQIPAEREFKYLGGLVGYVSYELAEYLEHVPENRDSAFPTFLFGLYLDGLIFDHRRGRCTYFSHGPDRSEEVRSGLAEPDSSEPFSLRSLSTDMSKGQFMAKVERAKAYIRTGDIDQVVLARRLAARFLGDPFAVYERLRSVNPSPYMYFLDWGDIQVGGASPELFLAVQDGHLFTCPIAGTRPISGDAERDAAYARELLQDGKELAEHNMLVDLSRADASRVSRPGTVEVTKYQQVERFSHVQHLVSQVEGDLEDGKDALDAFVALFPAGTVSGAPKVRAMEIIAELEESPRGPYAGIVGYFSLNGNMDSAIAIRTFFAKGRNLYLQAGAGIVADSVPEREWEETQGKLGAMLAALRWGLSDGG